MSALRVGDRCVIVGPLLLPENQPWTGMECIVLGFAQVGGETFVRTSDMPPWFKFGWYPQHVRKIDPPNKDEPITDFVPCEPEFFQDLMKRVKQRERC